MNKKDKEMLSRDLDDIRKDIKSLSESVMELRKRMGVQEQLQDALSSEIGDAWASQDRLAHYVAMPQEAPGSILITPTATGMTVSLPRKATVSVNEAYEARINAQGD
jgi:hypothetical protein